MGMIVANKWMRAGYGEHIRQFLQRTARPLEVIDFGHSPVFPEADTFPCIMLVARRLEPLRPGETPPEEEEMVACAVPRENWHDRLDLRAFVETRRHAVPTTLLREDGWSLENPPVQALLEKIRNTGVPLREYCGSSPVYGIKTGFNEAFVIDAGVCDNLVQQDPRSAELIKPLLRGRDIDRWRPRASGMYLITIPSSENQEWPWSGAGDQAESCFKESFPAVFGHLAAYKAALQKRQDQGRYWWELRSCDYMSVLEAPKIVYQDLAWFSEFARDTKGLLPINTVYVVGSVDPHLLATLNSPLIWWYMWRTAQHGKDEVLRMFTDYIETLPIAPAEPERTERLQNLAADLSDLTEDLQALEGDFARRFADATHVCADKMLIVGWLQLPFEALVARTAKHTAPDRRSSLPISHLADLHREARRQLANVLRRQSELEKQLAVLVEDAYNLTPEERNLLRNTRPVRDPIDVLQTKLGGKRNPAEHHMVNAESLLP